MNPLLQRLQQLGGQIVADPRSQMVMQGVQRVNQALQNNPQAFSFANQYGNLINQASALPGVQRAIPGVFDAARGIDKNFYQPLDQRQQKQEALLKKVKDPKHRLTNDEAADVVMMLTPIAGDLEPVGGINSILRSPSTTGPGIQAQLAKENADKLTKATAPAATYTGMGPAQTPRFPQGSYGPGQYYADETAIPFMKKMFNDPKKSLILQTQDDLDNLMKASIEAGSPSVTEYAYDKGFKFLYDKKSGTMIDLSNIGTMKLSDQMKAGVQPQAPTKSGPVDMMDKFRKK